ncbi:MAG: SIS domain-containing protein [Candidatus Nanosyncoccaceae bacterium]|jgi:hypothetical protein
MLDDNNVLDQFYVRDHLNEYMASVEQMAKLPAAELVKPSQAKITKLIWVGEDGASNLDMIKAWLDGTRTTLKIPVMLTSSLRPSWLDKNTLVIFKPDWQDSQKQIDLYKVATKSAQVVAPDSIIKSWLWQPLSLLKQRRVISQAEYRRLVEALVAAAQWADKQYGPGVSVSKNLAKQLALYAVGKTAVFTSTHEQMALSNRFVENIRIDAHNLAFSEELFTQMDRLKWGWSSHPIEKPFATFVVRYDYSATESKLLKERSRQLSGLMPASQEINIKADSLIQAILKADALAYYMATYLAVLNKRSLRPYVSVNS